MITSIPDYNVGFWINVVDEIPFFKIREQKITGFEESFDINREYYYNAFEVADIYDPKFIDIDDVKKIKTELGEPPNVSYPIYIICIEKENIKKVVYIGKSSSNISRFRGGHSTAIKLLEI